MIELRGLHLGNIARSPAESIRPDLWPDHAWVPALGCTGGVVHDLCGGGAATVTGCGWADAGIRPAVASAATRIATAALGASAPITYFFSGAIHSGGLNSNYGVFFGHPTYVQCRMYGSSLTSIDAAPIIGLVSGLPIILGQPIGMAVSYARSGVARFFYNGEIRKEATGSFTPLSSALTLGNSGDVGASRASDATYSAFLVLRRDITTAQILDLTADPLLPFRRRQPVYYSVPSGGGPSLAASSAWRVFTASAIATAWAIRAALDGATGWAVLAQSSAATGWRITAASDAATGWRIVADLDADTAWNLRAAAASPSSWRILAASEADTAWRIAADLNTSAAWAILTSLDAATAWAIISAGTLLANTGWAIRTDADTDTGWRLKTDTAADTAWAVRNARDAATAWDIQAALAGATAWRITTDLQADTAWTVITDMDVDAAWNILRADPTGTAWQVCTDLDTPTSWAVFSDIIPEPVRLFLAPGRQFILNAASRVLIITKTRP